MHLKAFACATAGGLLLTAGCDDDLNGGGFPVIIEPDIDPFFATGTADGDGDLTIVLERV